MKIRLITFLMLAFVSFAFKSDKMAYKLFTEDGKKTNFKKMMKALEKADLVFFGELHNDPVGHWMELEVTKALHSVKKDQLVLAAEMFESDNQLLLDEYLSDKISQSSFEKEARLWSNYKTDYKPLVEFAKANSLKFVASNVPRRYASVVHKGGFEGLEKLSDEAKKLLPPFPINYDPNVKCYADMLNMKGMGGHVNENFPKAQAIKDATMAYFTMQNWSKGKTVIHYNGSYHSNNHEGIIWHIKQSHPDLNIMTIANVTQEDIGELEEDNKELADFILCVPASMTKTY